MDMKKYILIFIISMVSLMANGAIRIMPLGDSITFDDAYNPKPDSLKAGYRSFLWYKLRDAGYWADFVGSQNTGWAVRPSFDGDNEGHPGWTSYDIANHVYSFLQSKPADIVLLMAGANDWSESVNGIESTLNQIDRYESNYHHHIKVILARIPNRRDHSQQWMSNFNVNLQNLANSRIANGDDIYVIDLEYGAGIDYHNDFQDPTHPNDTAYHKMANVWYDALRRFLPLPAKPNNPSNLVASSITTNSAVLHWQDNSDNENGFRIYSGNKLVATVSSNTKGYVLSNLEPRTTYNYSIEAFNDNGTSTKVAVTFTTKDDYSWLPAVYSILLN